MDISYFGIVGADMVPSSGVAEAFTGDISVSACGDADSGQLCALGWGDNRLGVCVSQGKEIAMASAFCRCGGLSCRCDSGGDGCD